MNKTNLTNKLISELNKVGIKHSLHIDTMVNLLIDNPEFKLGVKVGRQEMLDKVEKEIDIDLIWYSEDNFKGRNEELIQQIILVNKVLTILKQRILYKPSEEEKQNEKD